MTMYYNPLTTFNFCNQIRQLIDVDQIYYRDLITKILQSMNLNVTVHATPIWEIFFLQNGKKITISKVDNGETICFSFLALVNRIKIGECIRGELSIRCDAYRNHTDEFCNTVKKFVEEHL